MAAPIDFNEIARRIGVLRPLEIQAAHAQILLLSEKERLSMVDQLATKVEATLPIDPDPQEIEHIMLMASDICGLFKGTSGTLNRLSRYYSTKRTWSIFLLATSGASHKQLTLEIKRIRPSNFLEEENKNSIIDYDKSLDRRILYILKSIRPRIIAGCVMIYDIYHKNNDIIDYVEIGLLSAANSIRDTLESSLHLNSELSQSETRTVLSNSFHAVIEALDRNAKKENISYRVSRAEIVETIEQLVA